MEETEANNTTVIPERPKDTNEDISSLPNNPSNDSVKGTSMNKGDKSISSEASPGPRILAAKFSPPTPPPKKIPDKQPPMFTTYKAFFEAVASDKRLVPRDDLLVATYNAISAFDDEPSIDPNILKQPPVYDEDENPAFTRMCKEDPMGREIRYFHKRSPEWWAAYTKKVKESMEAQAPSGDDDDCDL
jgi:hypothetical protein